MRETRGVAVVTGASSGIGAATTVRLAKEGFAVIAGARRLDRLQEVAQASGARVLSLDVTDPGSVDAFVGAIDAPVDVLVNNAGLAWGLEPVAELPEEKVERMWATNFLGTLRMTQKLLAKLEEQGGGHIVNVGSIAAFEVYPGGAGYTASKHALRALTRTLRLELLGRPIRVTEIDPGMVETEFSLVRFDQDRTRAEEVYRGVEALTGEDVADCIAWAVTRPQHVNIDEIVVRPTQQATATMVARHS